MRQEVIRASLLNRVKQRANLVLVGLVGGIFCIFRLTAPIHPPGIAELLLPFAILFAHLALAPIPWQWTGDDAPRADLGRGFLQAFFFTAVWVGLVLFLLSLVSNAPELDPGLGFGGPLKPGSGPEFGGPMPIPPDGFGPPPMAPHHAFLPGMGLGLINLTFGIAFGWVFAEKEATEAKARVTADLLRQSQAKALQSQLDPHVLYNALNSLSELVYEDPLAAEEVITKLADLYRMLTVHGKADLIPLGQERAVVEAYLAMEQMRLGDRLSVSWDWPEYADSILAPPLFLQPLVENAIKHGISPSDKGGALVVSCERAGPVVTLRVDNSGMPLRQGAPQGVGLSNLEARLELWEGAGGSFSLACAEEWTIAKVQWTEGATA